MLSVKSIAHKASADDSGGATMVGRLAARSAAHSRRQLTRRQIIGVKPDTVQEPRTGTRRERLRQAAIDDIKGCAWRQVATDGPSSVSLRAIAREMGMTSSAIYRYFDSREQLVQELIADGYASLADALEAADLGPAAAHGPMERFFHIARSYRRWAVEHSTEYGLIFGTAICEPDVDPRVLEEHRRGVAVLFGVMIAGIEAGCIDLARVGPLPGTLERQLVRWQQSSGLPLAPEALAACLYIYAQLHGAISIELFQGVPKELVPATDLFEFQMRTVIGNFEGDLPT
jgi:AcrR family transcriptional regulator